MLSPPLVKLPALTCTMLVPAVLSVRSTEARAPLPSATMAITAATPMTTPSVVRPERRRLRPSAFQAICPLTARNRSTDAACLFVTQGVDGVELGGPARRIPAEQHADRRRHAEGDEHRGRRHHASPSAASTRSDTTPPGRARRRPAPPARLMATASVRNWRVTSRPRAPTAMRRPISLVRSVTDSSVMFMMPMPPTSSDTAATAASSQRIVPLARSSVPASCSSVTRSSSLTLPAIAAATFGRQAAGGDRPGRLGGDGEVVGLLGGDAVALAQQLADPLAHRRHLAGRGRGHRDVVELGQVEQLVGGGERHVDGVELVVARRRPHHPAGAGHHADDLERLVPQRDVLAHRVDLVAEQLLGHHRAEHHHHRLVVLLVLGEEAAAAQRPGALDVEQVQVGAVHAGEPALVADVARGRCRARRRPRTARRRARGWLRRRRTTASPRRRARPRDRRAAARPAGGRASPSGRLRDGGSAPTSAPANGSPASGSSGISSSTGSRIVSSASPWWATAPAESSVFGFQLPALIVSWLSPAARTCCSIDRCAPAPTAIIASTVATPTVMPSMVSAVCRRLRVSALNPMSMAGCRARRRSQRGGHG